MGSRKMLRNVSSGVDWTEHSKHGRGSTCAKTHVLAASGNLARQEMGLWVGLLER